MKFSSYLLASVNETANTWRKFDYHELNFDSTNGNLNVWYYTIIYYLSCEIRSDSTVRVHALKIELSGSGIKKSRSTPHLFSINWNMQMLFDITNGNEWHVILCPGIESTVNQSKESQNQILLYFSFWLFHLLHCKFILNQANKLNTSCDSIHF